MVTDAARHPECVSFPRIERRHVPNTGGAAAHVTSDFSATTATLWDGNQGPNPFPTGKPRSEGFGARPSPPAHGRSWTLSAFGTSGFAVYPAVTVTSFFWHSCPRLGLSLGAGLSLVVAMSHHSVCEGEGVRAFGAKATSRWQLGSLCPRAERYRALLGLS